MKTVFMLSILMIIHGYVESNDYDMKLFFSFPYALRRMKAFTITCTVTTSARQDYSVCVGPKRNDMCYGTARVNEDTCKTESGHKRYRLSCEWSKLKDPNQSRLLLNLIFDEVLAEDTGDWVCSLTDNKLVTSNVVQLKYKYCDDFLYGIQCLGRCNCLNPTEICNTMTGHCKSGCPNGWFGSSCNSQCRCAEGCPDGLNKKCLSCVRGFEGPSCQYDVDECATKTHTCVNEGEKCQNLLGYFKCVCKSGFINKGRRCFRENDWGSWMISEGRCGKSCRKTMYKRRVCHSSADFLKEVKCTGNDQESYTVLCRELQCANTHWSEFTQTTRTTCQKDCTAKVTYRRHCMVIPSDAKNSCPGSASFTLTEPCIGGDCDECKYNLDVCSQKVGMKCEDSADEYKCICKEGFFKVPEKSECAPNAAWSTWVKNYKMECSPSCVRMAEYKRYCTNPPPLAGGSSCLGESHHVVYENCTGGGCETKDTTIADVDKCANRLHSCVKEGELCENTKDGSFRCTCNKRYVREDNKCLRTVHWSSWQLMFLNCDFTCNLNKIYLRLCLNPDKLTGRNGKCSGKNLIVEKKPCNWYQCNISHWAPWEEMKHSNCSNTCTRTIYRERKCIYFNVTESEPCKGLSQSTVSEPCLGDDCAKDECSSGTHNCYEKIGMECQDQTPSYWCKCREGYTTVGDICARNGGWSTWIIHHIGDCLQNCLQDITLKRFCTNPFPEKGAKKCIGTDQYGNRSKCMGGCVNTSPSYKGLARKIKNTVPEAIASKTDEILNRNMIAVEVVIGVIGLSLIISIIIYYRSKLPRSVSTTKMVAEEKKEDTVSYDNPSFTEIGSNENCSCQQASYM